MSDLDWRRNVLSLATLIALVDYCVKILMNVKSRLKKDSKFGSSGCGDKLPFPVGQSSAFGESGR
jgi:hypothetical protein